MFQSPVEMQLRAESQRLTETMASGVGPCSFLSGVEMDPERVTKMLEMDYNELKTKCGVQYDFCVYFEDRNGSVIMINESSAGLGDTTVNVSGKPCGVNALPAPPPGCDIDADTYWAIACGGSDCNDNNPLVHPGAPEICNGVDDNCDGQIDEACADCLGAQYDGDSDGFSSFGAGCGMIDCDDTNPNIHPGAAEIQCNGIDEDCSGADFCPAQLCLDTDGDGYYQQAGCEGAVDCCDTGTEMALGCSLGTAFSVHPNAPEVCGDSIDQDCDGSDVICPVVPPGGVVLRCRWQTSCSGADIGQQITLLKAQRPMNSHVSTSLGAYAYSICCDLNVGVLGHSCTQPSNSTMAFKISALSNAHIQSAGGYPVGICLNATGSTPQCVYRPGSSCDIDETCVLALTGANNAMVAQCGSPAPYVNNICCKVR